jgi:ABC-type polysaccharide/polyol phosphate transport system ATPase subunit
VTLVLEKNRRSFKDFILKGKTIVHVSHELNTISEYCDRVLLLDKENNFN